MSQKTFALIAGIIFTLVALAHLTRIFQGWPVVIATYAVPMWVSWLGLIVTGVLAYYGLQYGTRK